MAQRLRFFIDPWPTDRDSAFQVDELEAGSARVDFKVEGGEWKSRSSEAASFDGPLFFIDGTRRVEARVMGGPPEAPVHGLFGSLAVGVVRSVAQRAEVLEVGVERLLVLGAGMLGEPVELRIGPQVLSFAALSVPGNSPLEVVAGLQNRMRELEADLAERTASLGGVVFLDGPLSFFTGTQAASAGVIKSLHRTYLEPGEFRLVGELKAGERTPLFLIADGKYDRFSWFLRLAPKRSLEHALAGIVRLETRTGLGLAEAVRLADLSAAVLPGFASNSLRDPRAPQNLLPVGALEQVLRHRLGSPLLIRRAIEESVLEGVFA